MQELNIEPLNDRLPPQNIEAEEAILGGILLDPEAVTRITDLLKPESFYLTAHQEIYRAAMALHAQGIPTDLMSVAAWLVDRDLLERVGGQKKLAALLERTISAVNIDQYARMVAERYQRRSLIRVGMDVVRRGYDTSTELNTVMSACEQDLFNVTQDRPQGGLASAAEILTATFAEIEGRATNTILPGLATSFYDLDAMTQGFQRSDLIILAARPSMGKCLAHGSEIVLADGSIATIEAIYQRRQAQLLTLGQDWRFHLTSPSAFVDDGHKPVFKVTTGLGRVIESTITHPFLTAKGWKQLAELEPGHVIAVPRKLEIFGSEVIANSELEALGPVAEAVPPLVFKLNRIQVALFLNRLFSTDGWATVLASGQSQLGYATVSERLARQVQHLLLRFGIVAALKKTSPQNKSNSQSAWQLDITDLQSIKTFIAEIGILGKEEALAHWQLDITDLQSIKTFIAEIGILGKEEALAQVQAALTEKPYQSECDLIPVEWQQIAQAKGTESWQALAKRAGIREDLNIHAGKHALSRETLLQLAFALDDLPLQQLATSDVYWDEIVSIESVGCKQVYDLTIPETHNFVANDICVHNTAFVLNIARNVAAAHKLPVAVFSLEMSKEQLMQRLLSTESRIESSRLRGGRITAHEWEPLGHAISALSQFPLFIDDTPNPSVTEVRSKCRRLQAEQGGALGMVILDYLQLMEGAGNENRVQELSRITRSLKALARELSVPVIALSQLSRGVEGRTNKRPMLSDLRESGCLTGDSLVTLADTGVQVPIRELVGKSDFAVWALNESTLKLERALVSNAFSTGVKPTLRLQTQLGRAIRATGNHKFRTIHGWKRLDELTVGERIAIPRSLSSQSEASMPASQLALLGHLIGDGCTLPRHAIQYTTREEDLAQTVASLAVTSFGEQIKPRIKREREWYQVYLPAAYRLTHGLRNPIASWLAGMGIFGLRSHEKYIPNQVFEQSEDAVALFLRHLWSTDGSIKLIQGKAVRPMAYYATSSERLARDVQALLLRLQINARLKVISQGGKGRDQYHLVITGNSDLSRFVSFVGAVGGYKQQSLSEVSDYLASHIENTNRDVIPYSVWRMYAVPAMQQHGITLRQMYERIGTAHAGTTIYQQNLSRGRAARLAQAVQSLELTYLAESDVYWDEIASITESGEEEVFDLTVPGHHNFVANNIVVHNSIEQDADVVIMLYRDEYYNPDTPDRGIGEVIIAKHRNGPVGTVKLLFEPQFTQFLNMASSNR
ncbi:replicative DNA helicase [Leptolyngbya sp. FACHB-261]|uniref:replicative DNA helicase n=1 Tax=Leptolyngbya sp. FACHB-261 TaxID=2692806 RepID=UPI0016883DD6|nr:replicative DNA helicase [Leptolyngbya sp. FACHB-261]MBD2100127.1 replicative DNA helicase [Leptolyngbya sp. FACHB-261]